jgi:hypothetical protein
VTEISSERGARVCRGCAAPGLRSVLDLGVQPLSNQMGRTATEVLSTFPLHLRICPACGLGQVGEFVTPERIFAEDYPYLSSTSAGWVAHARAYAEDRVGEMGLGPRDTVVEIASNDGYLLSAFQQLGTDVLGIEPARNVADLSEAAGVPTWCRFFGARTAELVVEHVGHPRLVVANNVMAHVPDLADFTEGLDVLADDHTLITVENPSLLNLLVERQFDTIYHEHFSYLSAHAVSRVAARYGLELVRVDQLPTHGGSNRYWLARAGAHPLDDSVARVLADEAQRGLLDPAVWTSFADDSRSAVEGLRSWLHDPGPRVRRRRQRRQAGPLPARIPSPRPAPGPPGRCRPRPRAAASLEHRGRAAPADRSSHPRGVGLGGDPAHERVELKRAAHVACTPGACRSR